jgi:chromosome segregation ATPase
MCTLLFIITDHHPIHATLIETDSKYEEMRGQIDFLNDAIEKLGQKMNTQLQSKNDELEQMKTNLTAANSNAEQLSSSNSQLQQQCAYAYNEYNKLEQSKMNIAQERDTLMLEVKQANDMVAQKQTQEIELMQQINSLMQQNDSLRTQHQQSINDWTTKCDEYNNKLEKKSTYYNALMLENMNLKKQTAELSKLVPTLESKVENLQFSNRQLQSAQEELSAKYQQQLMSTGSKVTIGFQQQQQQHIG